MNERQLCVAGSPMPKYAPGRWAHPDAAEVDCPCDCCAKYRCPHCGHTWKEELPE